MAPKAQLLVYFLKNGEIISDRKEIKFDEFSSNYISLETNSVKVKPGTNMRITIKTRPKSFVGILGIDQRVLIMNSGKRIKLC